jgi:hypothetical protein
MRTVRSPPASRRLATSSSWKPHRLPPPRGSTPPAPEAASRRADGGKGVSGAGTRCEHDYARTIQDEAVVRGVRWGVQLWTERESDSRVVAVVVVLGLLLSAPRCGIYLDAILQHDLFCSAYTRSWVSLIRKQASQLRCRLAGLCNIFAAMSRSGNVAQIEGCLVHRTMGRCRRSGNNSSAHHLATHTTWHVRCVRPSSNTRPEGTHRGARTSL